MEENKSFGAPTNGGSDMPDTAAENKKRPLAVKLSVAGLILSVFGGMGIFFALAGLIMGLSGRKKDAAQYNSAVFVGAGGMILSVIFGALALVMVLLLLNK